MDARCRIELLGGLRVVQGRRTITRFRSQRTGALLGYLAYHLHRAHPREALIELLWPEADLEAGRNSLSVALSSLRHQLEPPGVAAGTVIQADRLTVALNPAAVTTDVAEFEAALDAARAASGGKDEVHSSTLCRQLSDAVSLYRGELLAGYYEEWLPPEQALLAGRYLQALLELTAALERSGELEQALDTARRAANADPLREETHRELMRLLAAAGQPEAALRQYHELERLLKEELGAAPSGATRVLAQKIQLQAAGSMDVRTYGRMDEGSRTMPSSTLPHPHTSTRPHVHSSTLLPSGTVTFLLTDIEGSTAAWERAGAAYTAALEAHHALLRAAFREHGGHEVKEAGDSFLIAFERAGDAMAAAIAAQRRLAIADCELRIADWAPDGPDGPDNPQSAIRNPQWRMALHSGDVELAEGAYRGLTLHRAARVLSAAHGGQILCSQPAAELLRRDLESGIHLRDLGIYRLRDLPAPERLFQADYPDLPAHDFPPPRAEAVLAANLPLQLTRFFGRASEIQGLVRLLQPQGSRGAGEQGGGEGALVRSPLAPLPPCSLAALDASRLVTLTGPGGTGKTRLALAVAEWLLEAFGGAVWFVPLADLREADRIPDAVLDALRLPRSPNTEPLEQVVAALSQQPCLLLLDNCEQLLSIADRGGLTPGPSPPTAWRGGTDLTPGGHRAVTGGTSPPASASAPRVVASVPPLHEVGGEGPGVRPPGEAAIHNPQSAIDLVREFLERVPGLAVLATSRQVLNAAGEREFVVQPLPTPDDAHIPEQLTLYESVQLFTDRAQAVRPDFQLTRHNSKAVASLCNRLEGIPLAIELAASRAQVLTPAQMVQQLGKRFDFLVSRRRDLPERHRSLRAALDWSYRLLDPKLQRFFARLSVFRGGWTLEAAEAVCVDVRTSGGVDEEDQAGTSTPPHLPTSILPLDALAQFRECSLILAEETEHGMRFRMLETLREYADEQLEPTEREGAQQHHQSFFLELVEEAVERLRGADQAEWLERLEEDHDNFRAALRACAGQGGAAEVGMRLAGALAWFWEKRSHFGEGRAWLAAVLSAVGAEARTPVRAKALYEAGALAYRQGDNDSARALYDESLAVAREVGDRQRIAASLGVLGNLTCHQGDYASARSLHEESLGIFRELGMRGEAAVSLGGLARVAYEQGEYNSARHLLQESLAIHRELGDRNGEGIDLSNLGTVVYEQGDHAAARSFREESLAIKRQLGDRGGIAAMLSSLGDEACDQGDYTSARTLCEESLRIALELGVQSLIGDSLATLGHVAHEQGDDASAHSRYEESLAIRRRMGDRPGIAQTLDALAALLAAQNQPAQAARLWGAAEALRAELGSPLSSRRQERRAPPLATVRKALGEPAFIAAWEAGRALTWQEAVAEALGEEAAGR